jgi:hypothetical protein
MSETESFNITKSLPPTDYFGLNRSLPPESIWGLISAIIILGCVGMGFWIYALRLEIRVLMVRERRQNNDEMVDSNERENSGRV